MLELKKDPNGGPSGLQLIVNTKRLDAVTSRDFKKEFEDLAIEPVETLDINLAAVEFIDSSGVGALISLHKKMRFHEGLIKLFNINPQVKYVLELLKLNRIFVIESPSTSRN